MTEQNHAKQQAAAQAETITALIAALNCDFSRLEDLKEERADLISAAEDPESEDETTEALNALAAWHEENIEELNELQAAAGEYNDTHQAAEAIQEHPLSVEVRSAWIPANDVQFSAEEFRIVLCTGGPHVEITGDLDGYGTPHRAWIQYQDWGTPLTQYFDIEQSTLLEYCQQFYFGE